MAKEVQEVKNTTCLDCRQELITLENPGVYICSCGLRYSKELLESADPVMWQDIAEHRSFVRKDGYLEVWAYHRVPERV